MSIKSAAAPPGDVFKSSDCNFFKFVKTPEYVDKTMFIADVLNRYLKNPKSNPILFTRPRGFGKTLALSSLYYFCDYNYNATAGFSGLDIMKKHPVADVVREQFMMKFPVIWIDFEPVRYETFEKNMNAIKQIISNIFKNHKHMTVKLDSILKTQFDDILRGKADGHFLEESILFLSRLIQENYKTAPIILVDNYDKPFQTGYAHNHAKEINDFMWKFYKKTMRDNQFVARSIILTGVTRIPENDTDDILVNGFSVLDATFPEHFGFSAEEVKTLLKRSQSNMTFETLQKRYGGYSCGHSSMFHPASVINDIFHHKSNQWAETESNEQLGKIIVEHGLYPLLSIQRLLAGENVEKNLTTYVNFDEMTYQELNYWSYLVHSGYLTVIQAPYPQNTTWVRIPNSEVRERVQSLIKENLKTIPDYTTFTDGLINGNYTATKEFIQAYIQKAGFYFRVDRLESDVGKLREYVIQMLSGVKSRYNATIKITEKPNSVTMEIEPSKEEGVPVVVIVQTMNTFKGIWNHVKTKLWPRCKGVVSIMVVGRIVDVYVNCN